MMPLDWDASAKDLDDQLNNEMANDAISKIIDTSPKNNAEIDIGIPNNPATPKPDRGYWIRDRKV